MIRLRGALDEDLPELSILDRDVFGRIAYPYFVLRQHLDVFREGFLLAELDGDLVGYSLAAIASAKGDLAHYLALGVKASCRSRGIGRLLAEETLAALKGRGVRTVSLAVEPGNMHAQTLYQSLGFMQVRHEADYYGPAESRNILNLSFMPDQYSSHS